MISSEMESMAKAYPKQPNLAAIMLIICIRKIESRVLRPDCSHINLVLISAVFPLSLLGLSSPLMTRRSSTRAHLGQAHRL